MSRDRHPAFTLIELLVSLALSGVLIVLLNSQITNALFSDAKIKNQIEYRLEIENVLEQVAADILSASHQPNGLKSIKLYSTENEWQLHLKRFGVSPNTQKLHGIAVIWEFNAEGISRSINSVDGQYRRILSSKKINAKIEKIGINLIDLVLTSPSFTKSKLFAL